MINNNPNLTAERLRQLIDYDVETGIFKWKLLRRGIQFNKAPGSINKWGYLDIHIDYRHYAGHRLAWLHETGCMPACDIDHINGNRLDNRWINLRAVTRGENMQNVRRARKDNKSCGLQGVTWDKQRGLWKARIHKDGKMIGLGHHPTPEAGHAAYLLAKGRLHISFDVR